MKKRRLIDEVKNMKDMIKAMESQEDGLQRELAQESVALSL